MVADLLRKVRDRIATPDKWCKEAWYRDANGEQCSSRVAHSCCLLGAVDVYHEGDFPLRRASMDALYRANGGKSVVTFNDHPDTTHADVLALLDKAIAEAEKGGAS